MENNVNILKLLIEGDFVVPTSPHTLKHSFVFFKIG